MGFWEDGTGKLETPFRLLIFNIFFLRRMFYNKVLHLVLLKHAGCITENRSTFLRIPQIQWVVSFIASLWLLIDNVSSIHRTEKDGVTRGIIGKTTKAM